MRCRRLGYRYSLVIRSDRPGQGRGFAGEIADRRLSRLLDPSR